MREQEIVESTLSSLPRELQLMTWTQYLKSTTHSHLHRAVKVPQLLPGCGKTWKGLQVIAQNHGIEKSAPVIDNGFFLILAAGRI